ncbi:ABC transporter permease [Rhizobium sp. L80/93]|nr:MULTISPECIES: ABC transporter permease [unclassified Rhizobium]MBO9101000.1 ABC transporter permease [Rhizobium sp. L58/93]MBO9171665.1 ABC transporter permease [Rhizobium sp. L245/93]MBO9186589.1 ABC transporter permease [Rhizobium sp. E27B/91]QXZ86033.1 ABC transporter permease [Rhizobium sp. K1/93]QXZ92509.1 ABC transporter permease [Rhizobium sp. K15/93]
MASTNEAVPDKKSPWANLPWSSLSTYGIFIIFILLLIGFSLTVPHFATWANLSNVLQRNSIIGIVACGMLLMIITGGFDLSVGAVGAMSSVVAAAVIVNYSMPLGIIVALLLGLGVGLANGFFISKIGINPFVTTLATQVLVTGFLFVGTSAQPVYGVPESFTFLGLGRIGPVPVPTIIFAAVVIVTWAMLRFTTLGHYIYIVGGNKAAARLAGINVDRVLLTTYGIGGLFAAIAGIVLLGQTNIGQPASAGDWPLTAIAAVVVGGVPLSGGVGQIWSAVLGTLLLGIIANALNLLGVSPFWQPAVTGAVILVAVGLDSYQRKQRELR